MNILILSNSDVGLYQFRKEVIDGLLLDQHCVYIATPGGERVIDLMKMGCTFYQVNINRRGMNPLEDIKLIKTYASILRKCKPDVVLTYTIKPNIYGGFVCKLKKRPCIANITGLGTAIENGGWKAQLVLFLYKLALKDASCVFFQNKSNENYFKKKKINIKNEKLLPGSGVNLNYHKYETYPLSNSVCTFLFAGRIMKNKGIDELLTAFEEISQRYTNVKCIIVGSFEENYKEKIEKLDKKGVVKYVGFVKDIRPYLKECWAVIQPSYHEGMSNVLLEAAATGRPVLASRIPGCKETFEENITGIGFNAQDAYSLIHAIEKFINLTYEEKKRMGIEGRKKVEREFDRTIVVNEYKKEISKIGDGNEYI